MRNYIIFLFCFLFICCQQIKQADLVGEWHYIQLDYLNKSLHPEGADLSDQQPFIIFKKDGAAEIHSSGALISHGTYHLEKEIIRYEEVLSDGSKREIPFLIKELKNEELIFETMEADGKRITAKKVN